MAEITKELWPGWQTVRTLGRGSFGAVYEIRRDVFGHTERAAVKAISIPQSDSDLEELYDSGYDEASITRTFRAYLQNIVNEYSLMREMNGAANVVNCDDFRIDPHEGSIGWDIYIKMELLTPLTRAVDIRPPEEQVIRIAKDLCSALILCKKYGIIHRDIKPQNIFVSKNGDYKLGDFGIAKTIEKTSGGTKIGTYKYMAPEVFHSQPYGLTADIYSLGLVLHWLLNERRTPFLPLPPAPAEASGEEQARARRFSGEPIPAPLHGSEGLKRIVLKACAYDPAARYQSPEEMMAALQRLGSEPVPAAAGNRTAAPRSIPWDGAATDVRRPAAGISAAPPVYPDPVEKTAAADAATGRRGGWSAAPAAPLSSAEGTVSALQQQMASWQGENATVSAATPQGFARQSVPADATVGVMPEPLRPPVEAPRQQVPVRPAPVRQAAPVPASPIPQPAAPAQAAAPAGKRGLYSFEIVAPLFILIWVVILTIPSNPLMSSGDLQYLILLSAAIPAFLALIPPSAKARGKKAPILAWVSCILVGLVTALCILLSVVLVSQHAESSVSGPILTGTLCLIFLLVQSIRRLRVLR